MASYSLAWTNLALVNLVYHRVIHISSTVINYSNHTGANVMQMILISTLYNIFSILLKAELRYCLIFCYLALMVITKYVPYGKYENYFHSKFPWKHLSINDYLNNELLYLVKYNQNKKLFYKNKSLLCTSQTSKI